MTWSDLYDAELTSLSLGYVGRTYFILIRRDLEIDLTNGTDWLEIMQIRKLILVY